MNNFHRFFIITITLLLIKATAMGQDGIDSALFKKFGVKKMWVYVKIPILPNKTMNDSCMCETYEFDTLNRMIYENNNLKCYGWGGSYENFNTFNNKNQVTRTKQNSYNRTIFMDFVYNTNGDIERILHTNSDNADTVFTINQYSYNSKNKIKTIKNTNISGIDTSIFFMKYNYDSFDNVSQIFTYTKEMTLIKKETFETTPISKKLLEFTVEKKIPSESYSKGWNYYNTEAQLIKTQYNNNTWTEYVYDNNGFLSKALSYNINGKLNTIKLYFYELY
ncbi:MAG: hypothetical protein HUU47_08625 [Bacteroidetes bacterium]|nr:hypothetical protein [Bacteroidota bacterium]